MECVITDNISCEWVGRSGSDIKVFGASCLEEARVIAFEFAELPEGITLNKGFKAKWPYEDEPVPSEWREHHYFTSIDEHPPDQREWWEKG